MNTQTSVSKPHPGSPIPKASALAVMASRLSVEPDKLMATLKATVFQKATNEEMLALVVVSNEYGLNPLLKELYAFPAKGGGIVPIVSVDGWNKMLIRQEQFDGIEFEMVEGENGKPFSCTATIYVKNRSRPVKITEYFDECYRKTEPWENMPRRMLRNRTLCQASRVAFGFAGVYHEDEATPIIEVSSPPPRRVGLVQVTEGGESTQETTEAAPAAKQFTGQSEAKTARVELAEIIIKSGFTFDHFSKFCKDTGNIPDIDSMTGFDDLKETDAKRLLRAQAGLLKGLEQAKGMDAQ